MVSENGKSVLVVDDEKIVRESLRDWLVAGGYRVATANDGLQAIEMIKDSDYDIAVIDLRLPGKNGIDVLREGQKSRPDLKGVIITAYPSVGTTTKALRLGAVDYLTKPFEPEELDEIIEKSLSLKKTRQASVVKSADKVEAEGKAITSMMEENRVFPTPEDFQKKAVLRSFKEYRALYNWSVADPESFWSEIAGNLDWYKKWDKVVEYDFTDNPEVRYFVGGKINVSYNCLDRHLNGPRKNKAALIWQGEPGGESRVYTYQQLHNEVCRFANVLKKLGVKKGDAISIYMPMIPELEIAMLACARIGAMHSVVFGGFSAEALRDRIIDSNSKVLLTADGYYRSGKKIISKDNVVDVALAACPDVRKVVVVKRLGADVSMTPGRDSWWHEEISAEDISDTCEPEKMDADSPLFILYTSGSTGKPKGVLHTQGGYLTHCYLSMKWIFDIREEDTFWCTADVGWVTGHSYIVYGPLAVGTTSVMFEGVPNYPKPDRFWELVQKYKVNVFYTAPTVIRSLMRDGEEWPDKHDLSSLRLLGSVGEPINPEAWMWYHRVVGKEKCPIVDTWWQTETGGILMSPLPGAIPTKPGSATFPFPGVEPIILRDNG
ncbi:MAG: acetate--CoA ligase, partial [Dehalococcoidales bacterium]